MYGFTMMKGLIARTMASFLRLNVVLFFFFSNDVEFKRATIIYHITRKCYLIQLKKFCLLREDTI